MIMVRIETMPLDSPLWLPLPEKLASGAFELLSVNDHSNVYNRIYVLQLIVVILIVHYNI